MAITKENITRANETGTNRQSPSANTPLQRLTASTIIGDRIENPEGENLGKIEDLMINVRTGMIEYAVIEFGSFLGIGGKLFAIPFKQFQVDEGKEVMILNVDKEYLKESPGFDKSHWPGTNDDRDYFDSVSLYYGSYTTPR